MKANVLSFPGVAPEPPQMNKTKEAKGKASENLNEKIAFEHDWMTVKEVLAKTGLSRATVYRRCIPLLRNPRRVAGKFRSYEFKFPDSPTIYKRVVKSDVEAWMPSPAELLAAKGRNFVEPEK
jgi:predicted DNA-binding transcriptional regulator AlpA